MGATGGVIDVRSAVVADVADGDAVVFTLDAFSIHRAALIAGSGSLFRVR